MYFGRFKASDEDFHPNLHEFHEKPRPAGVVGGRGAGHAPAVREKGFGDLFLDSQAVAAPKSLQPGVARQGTAPFQGWF